MPGPFDGDNLTRRETGRDIVDGTLTSADLAAGAVTAGAIAAGGISDSTQFAAGVVDSTALAASAVTASKIASGAVTAGKIATGGVSAAGQFAAGVVDTTALGSKAVTGAKRAAELAGAAASDSITATGNFAQKCTIAGGRIAAGTVIRYAANGLLSGVAGGAQFKVELTLGGVVVHGTAVYTTVSNGDGFRLTGEIVWRDSTHYCGGGLAYCGTQGVNTTSLVIKSVDNVSLDTSTAQDVALKGTITVAGMTATLETFVVEVVG